MHKFKSAVTALGVAVFLMGSHAVAASDAIDQILEELAQAPDDVSANRLERQLRTEWSKSGSPTMDLLLKRGRDALDVDNMDAALEHLTALTDHAPEFAEGWHALALVYFNLEMFGPSADALERTLALNPNHFGALRGLGAIFEQVNKPDLAYDAYSRVLTLRPHDADVQEAIERLEGRVKGTSL